MSEQWYKLDNAAKIFPAVAANDGTNNFRLEAILTEDVDWPILPEVVQLALKRFPTFCVKLRRGMFWYYFEHNDQKPLIRKENHMLFDSVNTDEHNRFMFSVEYYGRRLSLEIFHALSDGTGGMEFFKTILYYYCSLKGKTIVNHGEVLTNEVEQLVGESQDSFVYHYDHNVKKYPKEQNAYHLKGTYYPNQWVGVIHMLADVKEVKSIAHQYQASVTEYLGAVLLYAIAKNYSYHKKASKNKPIRLFIPVNARKLFGSQTLRNFVLYMRMGFVPDKTVALTFADILQIVKQGFVEELDKDRLLARLVANVKIERNFLVRILPLPIKKAIMKIAYNLCGASLNTISFSNLGVVHLPEAMKEYIEEIHFINGVSQQSPLNLTAVSYQEQMTLTFSTCLKERNVSRAFARRLAEDGIQLTIISNELEV